MMKPRTAPVWASALLAMVIASSACTSIDPSAGWPDPRPLGADFRAYRPPSEPEATNPASPIEPAERDALMLPMALARALLQNPQLQAFAYEVRAREAERMQAGRWPNFAVSIDAEEVSSDEPLAELSEAEQVFEISQRIVLGGDVRFRENVAAAQRNLAGWDYEAARLDVITEVRQAFAGTLAAQERLTQTRDLSQLAESLYRAVAQQVEAGQVSPVELDRASVERAQARIESRRAEEQLRAARQRLATAVGASEPRFESVRGNLEDVRQIPALSALRPLLVRNPALARFRDVHRRREAQLDLERARRIPDVTLSGGVQRFGATGEDAIVFGLSIPIPLLDRQRGAIEAARYRLDQAGQAQRAVALELAAALESAYRNLTAAYAAVTALRDQVLPAALAAFQTFGEGYRLGEFDLLRVIDAQRTLFDARLQYVAALETYRQALAEVERVVATPLSMIGTPRP